MTNVSMLIVSLLIFSSLRGHKPLNELGFFFP